MTVIEQLAEQVFSRPPSREGVEEIVGLAVLDILGCAAAGAGTDGGRSARLAAGRSFGHGSAGIWFSSSRSSPAGAAFVNSIYASALDLDDGHRAAAGHPGAAIIPAVLACADANTPTETLLASISLGYEIGVRIAAARDITKLRTASSGLWCGYGVAAAIAWMRGASRSEFAQALAIAGMTSPGLEAAGRGSMNNTIKEGIPFATVSGMMAVDLAMAGATGPLHILDVPEFYDRAGILGDWAVDWKINGIYFKTYSCCRWAHAAIDAALRLKSDHKLNYEDIIDIDIATFPRALRLSNQPDPHNLEAAQYSIPFCVALAVTRGPEALLPIRSSSLEDAPTIALAKQIHLRDDPDFATAFPANVPARVSIRTRHRVVSAEALAPAGDPSAPFSFEQMRQKFTTLASELVPASASEALAAAALAISDTGAEPIFRLLEHSPHA
ncbi:MmgE/PrpD family protein [Paracoccus pantotrophus]|uniref:MmgE/PrpD family protein n=1 Tax=Paracoccus pantotrophus TaxID=82367 RepID=UPI0008EC4132|nr:MmgE/PrpD family protein [Paracoccus pantotrophus]MDF3855767.1 MmgE/PrpD family protein [Paracoccus pantotrophus]SFP19651.1 2-methylcitrate dehydratase PrpD [Paracoccus pantotrophus]